MARKKILVCGGTGFIGRNMAEALAAQDEYEVHATHFTRDPFKHPRIQWHRADLTDRAVVNQLVVGMDAILHYAALATNFKDVVERPYIHTTDNVVMCSYLIRAAFEQKVPHFIFPSCGYIYNSSDTPFTEKDLDYNNLPRGSMGAAWSKLYVEKMCEFYSGLGGTKFTVIRQANIYGPNDKTNLDTAHALPATIMKAINSKDGKIEVWGDGTQKRDQLYITDLSDFVLSVLKAKKNAFDFFNIGSGRFVTMRELAEKTIKATGKNLRIEYNTAQPSTASRWALNSSLAKEQFGWSPKVSIDEGIARTLKWYQEVL